MQQLHVSLSDYEQAAAFEPPSRDFELRVTGNDIERSGTVTGRTGPALLVWETDGSQTASALVTGNRLGGTTMVVAAIIRVPEVVADGNIVRNFNGKALSLSSQGAGRGHRQHHVRRPAAPAAVVPEPARQVESVEHDPPLNAVAATFAHGAGPVADSADARGVESQGGLAWRREVDRRAGGALAAVRAAPPSAQPLDPAVGAAVGRLVAAFAPALGLDQDATDPARA